MAIYSPDGRSIVSLGSSAGGSWGPGGAWGAAGAGGAGGNVFQQYLDSVKKAQLEAKAANESRYAEGKQGYQDRYTRGTNMIANVGAQEQRDIAASGAAQQAQIGAGMTMRGLGNSSALPSMKAGAQRQTADVAARAAERVALMKQGVDSQLSGDTLGFIERRSDPYPDMNAAMSLASQYGYGRGGGGGYAATTNRAPAEYQPPKDYGIYDTPGVPGITGTGKTPPLWPSGGAMTGVMTRPGLGPNPVSGTGYYDATNRNPWPGRDSPWGAIGGSPSSALKAYGF